MTMAEGVGNVFQTAINNMKHALQQLEGAYISFYFMSYFFLFTCKGRCYFYDECVISNRIQSYQNLTTRCNLVQTVCKFRFDLFIALAFFNNYGS